MADVKFACPGCQLHIKVGLEYVGMTSTCPECQQQFKIPAPPGEVKFACGGCQLRLALHESYIGSQIACPSCQAQVIVPSPAGHAAPAPAPAKPAPVPAKPKAVSVADRVGSPPNVRPAATAAAASGSGPRTRPPNVGAPPNVAAPAPARPVAAAAVQAASSCPKCSAALEADAIICTACGYNVETGEEMESAVVKVKPPPPPAGGVPPGGRRAAVRPKVAAAVAPGAPDKSVKLTFWVLNGISLLLFAATFVVPLALVVMYLFAGLLASVAGIWTLIAAAKHSTGQFLLSFFLPPYQIYFVYWVNWNPMLKRVFGASLIGSFLTGIAVVVSFARILGEVTQGAQ